MRRRLHLSVVAVLCAAMLAAQLPAFATGRPTTVAAASDEVTAPASTSHVAPVVADRADRALASNGNVGVARARIVDAYGKLPMAFESTQTGEFLARGNGYLVATEATGATLWLRNPAPGLAEGDVLLASADASRPAYSAVHIAFVGASPSAALIGEGQLPGRVNYFIGSDPSGWRTDIPTFAKVRSAGVWPGIDVAYYGNQQELEFDFALAAGADPSSIRLAFAGASSIAVLESGELRLGLDDGAVTVRQPTVYQDIDGARHTFSAAYTVDGEQVGVRVDGYDPSHALVIDPVITYSTFLGGANLDKVGALAVDSAGNAYLAGVTMSTGFPATAGAYTSTGVSVPNTSDAFVTKLNATGSALVYSTYLGGSDADIALGVAVDASGNAYVAGHTFSFDFPTTAGAFATAHNTATGDDVFVTKLDPSGAALVYSTYIGGQGGDVANAIAVAADGTAVVAGTTSSADFPRVPTTLGSAYGGGVADAFVTRLNATGTGLVYSRFLGGSGPPTNDTTQRFGDQAKGIALDGSGNAYVTGVTDSPDFPVAGALLTTHQSIPNNDPSGYADAFVTKVDTSGALSYSRFLGGTRTDGAEGIAVDSAGNAYVTGGTASLDFPTVNAFDPSYNSGGDAFFAKLNASGSALLYSTYLGGSDGAYDTGYGVAASSGYAAVVGLTDSASFPAVSALQARGGGHDAFVTQINTNASGAASLTFSSYLGGSGTESDRVAVAIGPAGIYVGGTTNSTNFQTTAAAYDQTQNGAEDGFALLISTATTLTVNTAADHDDGSCNASDCTLREAINAANALPGSKIVFNIPETVFTTPGSTNCGTQVSTPFDNSNGFGVTPGAAPPTFSAGTNTYCVTHVWTYHWMSGVSPAPGTNSLLNASGGTIGTWSAMGSAGQPPNTANANWDADVPLSPPTVITGTFECDTSDRASWSQNSVSSNKGFCKVSVVQATVTPGTTTHTGTIPAIQPTSPLPNITAPTTIDGLTQSVGKVVLDGSLLTTGDGLAATGADVSINGLTLVRFPGAGIHLLGGDAHVFNNSIGLDTSGAAAANGDGVKVDSSNNLIGGDAASRNVISGNTGRGIWINTGTSNVVAGNYIGTNAAGTSALGNFDGVFIASAFNTIGGLDVAERNVISGNSRHGVVASSESANNNTIRKNYIGPDATGTVDITNASTAPGGGVGVLLDAPNNLVNDNLISGNGTGVFIAGTRNSIAANQIGFGATFNRIGNSFSGVEITGSNNSVSGSVIRFSGGAGIAVRTGTGNRFSDNSIAENGGLAIDLGSDGRTPNDAAPDADTGANDLQNFPVVTAAHSDASTTTVAFSLVSAPNTAYDVEFYTDPAQTAGRDAHGFRIATVLVTTDANGDFSGSVGLLTPVTPGKYLLATATDPNGNTSEYSDATVVVGTADLQVTKTAPSVAAGTAILRYDITLTNNGPHGATGATVVDDLPAGTTFFAASIGCTYAAAANRVTCTPTVMVNGQPQPTAIAAGQAFAFALLVRLPAVTTGSIIVTNTARVGASDQFDPNSENDASSASTAVVPGADLSLTKSDSPDPVLAPLDLTYTLTAANAGPSTATGVTITDQLPSDVTYVSSSTGCTFTAPTVICVVGMIASGASRSVTITVDPAATTVRTINNTATVTANEPDPNTANNTVSEGTTVQVGADIAVNIAAGAPSLDTLATQLNSNVIAGEVSHFSVATTNLGPLTAHGVTMQVTVPTGVDLVSIGTPLGTTCGTANADGMVVCTSTFDLAASTSLALDVAVRPTFVGTFALTAHASALEADPFPQSNDASLSINSLAGTADLSVTLASSPASVIGGQSISYTADVANAGPNLATQVIARFTVPTGATLTGVSASCAPLPAPPTLAVLVVDAPPTVPCSLGSLASGAHVQVSITFTAPFRTTSLTESVTVSSQATDPDLTNNIATATTGVRSGIYGTAQYRQKDANGVVQTYVFGSGNNGRVRLYSGSTLLATQQPAADGSYNFTTVAPNAAYAVEYTGDVSFGGTIGTLRRVAAVGVMTDAFAVAQAPDTKPVLSLHNSTYKTAFPIAVKGTVVGPRSWQVNDTNQLPYESGWYSLPVCSGERVTITVTHNSVPNRVAVYRDIDKVAAMTPTDTHGLNNGVLPVDFGGDIPVDFGGDIPVDFGGDIPVDFGGDIPVDFGGDIPVDFGGDIPVDFGGDIPVDFGGELPLFYGTESPDNTGSSSSAVKRALRAVSPNVGMGDGVISIQTWDQCEIYYIRVLGTKGAFDPSNEFTVNATRATTDCAGIDTTTLVRYTAGFDALHPRPTTTPSSLVLVNSARLRHSPLPDGTLGAPLTATEATALKQRLALAAPAGQTATVVELSGWPGIQEAYDQWDANAFTNRSCFVAQEIVAEAIVSLVRAFRAPQPAQFHYVTLIGNAVPSCVNADQTLNGNERGYGPRVQANSPSDVALRAGQIQTDDCYGVMTPTTDGITAIDLPDRSVGIGRVVESYEDINTMIDTYLDPQKGGHLALAPQSALVLGYDYVADGATEQARILRDDAKVPTVDSSLMLPYGKGPGDPAAWSADDFRAKLAARHWDVYGLNAHFAHPVMGSPKGTTWSVNEAQAAAAQFRGSVAVSPGCHSGYPLVDPDGVTGYLTDFASAWNGDGASLFLNKGYGYAGLSTVNYSEILITSLFTHARYGSGPRSYGDLLTEIKYAYRDGYSDLNPLDFKAIKEFAFYGFPMAGIDLPAAGRIPFPSTGGIATTIIRPDLASALIAEDFSNATTGAAHRLERHDVVGGSATDPNTPIVASYYTSDGAFESHSSTPVMPRLTRGIASSNTQQVARGVTLESATYTDTPGFRPYIDPAVFETRVIVPGFVSTGAFPRSPSAINAGENLVIQPMQYTSATGGSGPLLTGTARLYSNVTTRVWYSSATGESAQAGPPVIYRTTLTKNGTKLHVQVLAGAQLAQGLERAVIAYTANTGTLYGRWASNTVLTQDLPASAVRASLGSVLAVYDTDIETAGTDATAEDVVVFAQVVAGNALVSRDDNEGHYYAFAPSTASTTHAKATTALALVASGAQYGGKATLSATLRTPDAAGTTLANKTVLITLDGVTKRVTTNTLGQASATFQVAEPAGTYEAAAAFLEDADFLASSAAANVTVTAATVTITPGASAATCPTNAPAGAQCVQYSDQVALGTLRANGEILGLFSAIIDLGTAGKTVTFTDGFGRAIFSTLSIAGIQAGATYTGSLRVCPRFDETSLTPCTSDGFYAIASLPVTVVVTQEDGTVASTTPPDPQRIGAITLRGTFTQTNDGMSGPLANGSARVRFTLGASITLTGNVAADGTVVVTSLTVPAGVYAITLQADGNYTSPAVDAGLLVVYDPAGGFATGGGWINSPAGAYTPEPTTSGRSNFGFNAKYQTGATVPTGETTFQMKRPTSTTARFKSSSYDWLVISGTRAEFQGTGTIDGRGSYKFHVAAIDSGEGQTTDKFRIRIWDPATNAVIYDNEAASPVEADPTTLIAGGNIQIH